MLSLFGYAFILGLLFNAAPGAIFAASLKRGIQGGFMPAFMIQIGSLLGDFLWAVLGLSGAAFLFSIAAVKMPLSVVGAVMLAWLGFGCFKDALSAAPVVDNTSPSDAKSDLMVGAGLSLSNPINISYWAGLAGTISALGVQEPDGRAFITFLAGFMLSSLLWCFVCAGAIALLQKMVNRIIWVIINISCGLGLSYFAIKVVLNLL